MRIKYSCIVLIVLVSAILSGCSATKYVSDGETLLDKVSVTSDVDEVSTQSYKSYIRQKANARWFSIFKIPLGTYSLSGRDTSKWINRTLRSLGEAPVIFDSIETERTKADLITAMQNKGYMDAGVDVKLSHHRKRTRVEYQLLPRDLYFVQSFKYNIRDSDIARLILSSDTASSLISPGMAFNIDVLDKERSRITSLLQNRGYYKFHKDFITFQADTLNALKRVNVVMNIALYRANSNSEEGMHPRYNVRGISYSTDQDELHLRKKVLTENTDIQLNKPFSSKDLRNTYNNFGHLQAVKYTNIQWKEYPDSLGLDCNIQLSTNKPSTLIFQPEGTNTAGDLGAAASLTYQNRNLFHGSELLSLTFRGAYEAITGLQGYNDKNFEEYSVEAKLKFPRFLIPFLSRHFKRSVHASSEVSVMYDLQNRPEFYRRVLSSIWRYRWSNSNAQKQYRVDLLDLNYVFMPWISDTFRKVYLDSVNSRNAILRYNYENLFIMKIGFGYNYSGKDYSLKLNVETAGNLLHGVSSLFKFAKDDNNQYTLFNIAYAQYAKADIDITKNITIDYRNSLAMHLGFGIAYPYGNSNILPYEKRYFSGGANSVRGWSVRSLGPGSYNGGNGSIDFINQTGDVKLDLNVEYRTYLFWKLNGALFVDGGNIWTLRNYADQPGGQFRFSSFLNQIAFSYGLGLRLNFDYFILRFDMGMKAVNPAYSDSERHYPIIHPSLSRDWTFHFAVGLPF